MRQMNADAVEKRAVEFTVGGKDFFLKRVTIRGAIHLAGVLGASEDPDLLTDDPVERSQSMMQGAEVWQKAVLLICEDADGNAPTEEEALDGPTVPEAQAMVRRVFGNED